MADFAKHHSALSAEGIRVIAASVDDLDAAKKMVDAEHIPYEVAYGLDVKTAARALGGFYDGKEDFLHPANFLLKPDGTVSVSSYSSGAMGRMNAVEVLKTVQHLKSKA